MTQRVTRREVYPAGPRQAKPRPRSGNRRADWVRPGRQVARRPTDRAALPRRDPGGIGVTGLQEDQGALVRPQAPTRSLMPAFRLASKRAGALLSFAVLAAVSCSDSGTTTPPPPPPALTTINVTVQASSITRGQTVTATAAGVVTGVAAGTTDIIATARRQDGKADDHRDGAAGHQDQRSGIERRNAGRLGKALQPLAPRGTCVRRRYRTSTTTGSRSRRSQNV